MFRIVEKKLLAENIYRLRVEAPRVAHSAPARQFVIVRTDARRTRAADHSRLRHTADGTVTIVTTDHRYVDAQDVLGVGDALADLAARWATRRSLSTCRSRSCAAGCYLFVAGGVGTAPVYPQVKWLHEHGVAGGCDHRRQDLVDAIYKEGWPAWSTNLYIATDDGSEGQGHGHGQDQGADRGPKAAITTNVSPSAP